MPQNPHFVTSYCNFPHDLKTGRPIGHECYVLPVRALQAEREGNTDLAIEILQRSNFKSRGTVRGRKKKVAHDPEILRGMARGPWASMWGDEAEEAGKSLSGLDLYETAPETPAWAEKWARKLADVICRVNGDTNLADLYAAAQAAGFAKDKEAFGFYLGMQSAGHGVSWDDDIRGGTDLVIRYPSTEFYEGAGVDERFIRGE